MENINENLNSQEAGEAREDVHNVLESEPRTEKISVNEVAESLGLQEEEKKLPNGRVVKGITWKPDMLPDAYEYVNQKRSELGLGINDVLIIDGAGPTWLLQAISHACHPVSTAVNYAQGTEKINIPLSGCPIEGMGKGDNLEFSVVENENHVLVEFKLNQSQIDVDETVRSLVAPEVPKNKPVHISGRGPIAIAGSLAEAYAHKVPYVASFQPGVGYVVSISHDVDNPLGTIKE